MENKSTIQAFAHCDGPCGVYDPASARIAAEAVERELRPARLIAAPANVRVWLDDEGHWPRDPNTVEGP